MHNFLPVHRVFIQQFFDDFAFHQGFSDDGFHIFRLDLLVKYLLRVYDHQRTSFTESMTAGQTNGNLIC